MQMDQDSQDALEQEFLVLDETSCDSITKSEADRLLSGGQEDMEVGSPRPATNPTSSDPPTTKPRFKILRPTLFLNVSAPTSTQDPPTINTSNFDPLSKNFEKALNINEQPTDSEPNKGSGVVMAGKPASHEHTSQGSQKEVANKANKEEQEEIAKKKTKKRAPKRPIGEREPKVRKSRKRILDKYTGDPTFEEVQYRSTSEIIYKKQRLQQPLMPRPDYPSSDEEGEIHIEEVSESESDNDKSWKRKKNKLSRVVKPSEAVPDANNSTSIIPTIIRLPEVHFVNSSKELGFFSVRQMWELEDRQHRLYEVEKHFESRPLSDTPIHQYEQRIRKGNFYGNHRRGFINFAKPVEGREQEKKINKAIEDFIITIKRTGVLTFNTEGHIHGKKDAKVMLALGNLQGDVFFWNDVQKLPRIFRHMLEDLSITHIVTGKQIGRAHV